MLVYAKIAKWNKKFTVNMRKKKSCGKKGVVFIFRAGFRLSAALIRKLRPLPPLPKKKKPRSRKFPVLSCSCYMIIYVYQTYRGTGYII